MTQDTQQFRLQVYLNPPQNLGAEAIKLPAGLELQEKHGGKFDPSQAMGLLPQAPKSPRSDGTSLVYHTPSAQRKVLLCGNPRRSCVNILELFVLKTSLNDCVL